MYHLDSILFKALNKISLKIDQGEVITITGPSGSGKSTLLNMIGLIDTPDEGEIIYSNRDLNLLTEKNKSIFRRDTIGYVFQKFHLIPVLTAVENVSLPGLLQGRPYKEVMDKSYELLAAVGLNNFSTRPVKFLSGGQRQRVAVARSLINTPPHYPCR